MEALPCHPGTAGSVRRRKTEGRPLGRWTPPGAGGSDAPHSEGTAWPPRGPCSPSAASTPGLVLSDTKTKMSRFSSHFHNSAHARHKRM